MRTERSKRARHDPKEKPTVKFFFGRRVWERDYVYSASSLQRDRTRSNIAGVSKPVSVFCALTW